MINYNMEDTLARSLDSLLRQLDEQYEVVIVDDGSSDKSVEVIRGMQARYSNLFLFEYPRDSKRKMGATRNISIEKARGQYVLLHLDGDDVFGPYIKGFMAVFHKIEEAVNRDILLSGYHVNVGKRSFLMERGPYRNIFYTEDRDMWNRLAAENAYLPLEHVDFIERLPRKETNRIWRALSYTWKIMGNDFAGGTSLPQYIRYEYLRWPQLSWKLRLYRAMIMLPVWVMSWFSTPLADRGKSLSHEDFATYREEARGTFKQIMGRYNKDPTLTFLREEVRWIFDVDKT